MQDGAGSGIPEIAANHGKSAAQVTLRWHLQEGRSAIPKSGNPGRIAENFNILDFELTADQVGAMHALDTGKRNGPEPDSITLENYSWPIPEARDHGGRQMPSRFKAKDFQTRHLL